jgi:hypothetical protein
MGDALWTAGVWGGAPHKVAQNQPAPSSPPVIVKIVEEPHDPTGLADVLIGSLGLTGVIVLFAVAAGLLFASLLFWYRSRHA